MCDPQKVCFHVDNDHCKVLNKSRVFLFVDDIKKILGIGDGVRGRGMHPHLGSLFCEEQNYNASARRRRRHQCISLLFSHTNQHGYNCCPFGVNNSS